MSMVGPPTGADVDQVNSAVFHTRSRTAVKARTRQPEGLTCSVILIQRSCKGEMSNWPLCLNPVCGVYKAPAVQTQLKPSKLGRHLLTQAHTAVNRLHVHTTRLFELGTSMAGARVRGTAVHADEAHRLEATSPTSSPGQG